MTRVVKIGYLAQYNEAGHDLIPLHRWDHVDDQGRERGKSPRDARWRVTEYGPDALREWIDDGGNVGVRLREGDLVIDFDPRNAEGRGEEVMDELDLTYGIDLASCPAVRTGSGGLHFYLRMPAGMRVLNGLGDEFPGVEFKAHGRQVVAAGSKHPNGNTYEWLTTVPLAQAPDAPAALLEAIKRRTESSTTSEAGELTCEELAGLLAQLPVEEFQEHDRWLEVMMACHHGTAGAGVNEFVAWSTGDPAFADQGGVIRERWRSVDDDRPGGITVATLYHRVAEHGGSPPRPSAAEDFADEIVEEPAEPVPGLRNPLLERYKDGKPKATFANALECVMALGIRPEYDNFRDKVVLRGDLGPVRSMYPASCAIWDDDLMHAVRRVILERWKCELDLRKVKEAIVAVALERPFNPVEEYLRSLEWDGIDRISTWMTTYMGVKKSPYTSAVGRIFFLSAVARILQPGIKYDTMIVLESPEQGYAKSTMLGVLCGPDFLLEGLPHKSFGDKDVVDAMRGKWIIEMAELDHMRRSDVDSLKAFLSRTSDRARLAYAHNSKDFPRQCVLVGTTNETIYLTDITGNRRFLPIEVKHHVRLDPLKQDRDQLWAQAVVEWGQNPTHEALWMPQDLWGVAKVEQDRRRAEDPWEDSIVTFLSELDPNVDKIATSTLMIHACGVTANKAKQGDFQRLAAIMRKLGWHSGRVMEDKVQVRGYRKKE